MKKALAILLVIFMSMGTMAASYGSTDLTKPSIDDPSDQQTSATARSTLGSKDTDTDETMLDYLRGLGTSGPRPPDFPVPPEPQHADDTRLTPIFLDAIFLYNDRLTDEWLPVPTRWEIDRGLEAPVTFQNGTAHEIHGKLFERRIWENTTYFDDIGIPEVPVSIAFDGDPVSISGITTSNGTSYIEPFGENQNGTFQLLVDINRPAGEYELTLTYDGPSPPYAGLTHKAVVYVNHPTIIEVGVVPGTVTVGETITIQGRLSDETGRPVPSVPIKLWFDNVLLGPSRAGVYIDDVKVQGTTFSDDFENNSARGWTTYNVPDREVGNQWEHGTPGEGVGPDSVHSGSRLWGTALDDNYQRGAWSFLVTPSIDLSADQEYSLSFYAWWSVYWVEDFAYLLASSDGGATWADEDRIDFMGTDLAQTLWTHFEFNVTNLKGSDDVKFAFVFYSADKTLDVRTDATFTYNYLIPMSTTADQHRVEVIFKGNLLFRMGQAYEDVGVKRITHFEFETNMSRKVGHRNAPVKLVAYLRDNMGEVPSMTIRGHAYNYQVTIYWDEKWIIDPLRGRVGPPPTMDPVIGEMSINYVVAWDETLGPHNVTFRFPGDDYYTAVQMTDIYYVKAETYLKFPDDEDFKRFRGQSINIRAELRIVPQQSIEDTELGDPVSGEFIKIYWNGQQISSRRPQFDGTYNTDYLVPSTHLLGDVPVMFVYEGQSLYEPLTFIVDFTIISETFIILVDQHVLKGSWVYINGTVLDDRNDPVPFAPIYIIWKRAPEIGRVTTKTDGSFSLHYYIQYEDRLGNITVIARFKGDRIHLANETSAVFTVKVISTIVRTEQVLSVAHGDQVQISGKLYDGNRFDSTPIQGQLVTLLIDGIIVGEKQTTFNGSVAFTVLIDPETFKGGEVLVVLTFAGSEFYTEASNETNLFIKADMFATLTEAYLNGVPFDPEKDVVRMDDTIQARVNIQNFEHQPLSDWSVSVSYIDIPWPHKYPISSGMTDSQGYFEFTWTPQNNVSGIKKVQIQGEGLFTINSLAFDITYIVPPLQTTKDTELIDIVGSLHVTTDSTLNLVIKVRNPEDWRIEDLEFSLVSPPEGMVITYEGTITWKPDEDQVGDHPITVWLYDGQNSKTFSFNVTVTKKEAFIGFGNDVMIGLALGILVVGLLVAVVLVGRKKNQ